MYPVIEVEGLSKKYVMGETVVHALRQVSFRVQVGAFVALMGPSGSGKSTLMHLLGCLDTPTVGHYWLDGRDVSHLSRRERAAVFRQLVEARTHETIEHTLNGRVPITIRCASC